MQIKVNFLCRDSILAAPLAIEVARCLALAASRKISGVVEELSVFFKSPMFRSRPVTNDFFLQQKLFMDWLAQADK
jgi:myo-inositol-1-phosphate synthase